MSFTSTKVIQQSTMRSLKTRSDLWLAKMKIMTLISSRSLRRLTLSRRNNGKSRVALGLPAETKVFSMNTWTLLITGKISNALPHTWQLRRLLFILAKTQKLKCLLCLMTYSPCRLNKLDWGLMKYRHRRQENLGCVWGRQDKPMN